MAQRLVRRVCPDCREPYEPSREEIEELGVNPQRLIGRTIYRPREDGCEACKRTATAAAPASTSSWWSTTRSARW